jgi:hypothetical protein
MIKRRRREDVFPNIYQLRTDNHKQLFIDKHTIKPSNETVKVPMTDAEGLRRAYQHGNYFIWGDRMYVAGTREGVDIWDDLTKIPSFGDVRHSNRYKNVEKALKENPQIKHLSGHSLGGSVVLELQKNYPEREYTTRTFGAPVSSDVTELVEHGNDEIQRYRHFGDVISSRDVMAKTFAPRFDWNWKTGVAGAILKNHSYDYLGSKFTTEADVPAETLNPDGSISAIG